MAKSRGPFRFVASSRRGTYSVWRGDEHIGYVQRETFRVQGVSHSVWRPALARTNGALAPIELASESTRDAAARALWNARRCL